MHSIRYAFRTLKPIWLLALLAGIPLVLAIHAGEQTLERKLAAILPFQSARVITQSYTPTVAQTHQQLAAQLAAIAPVLARLLGCQYHAANGADLTLQDFNNPSHDPRQIALCVKPGPLPAALTSAPKGSLFYPTVQAMRQLATLLTSSANHPRSDAAYNDDLSTTLELFRTTMQRAFENIDSMGLARALGLTEQPTILPG